MEGERLVDITPSPNLISTLGKHDYTFESALAELIDNAISASTNTPNRTIHIDFDAVNKVL